jgi:hypothetical protein
LKNYYGAIAPTLINNLNFEGENSYGTLIWEVHTKPEDSKALTFFRMSQEYGTIFINLNNSSLYREGDKFDFWVSTVVSLDHVPNAGTFIDSPVTISSDNFHVTVIDDPTD